MSLQVSVTSAKLSVKFYKSTYYSTISKVLCMHNTMHIIYFKILKIIYLTNFNSIKLLCMHNIIIFGNITLQD